MGVVFAGYSGFTQHLQLTATRQKKGRKPKSKFHTPGHLGRLEFLPNCAQCHLSMYITARSVARAVHSLRRRHDRRTAASTDVHRLSSAGAAQSQHCKATLCTHAPVCVHTTQGFPPIPSASRYITNSADDTSPPPPTQVCLLIRQVT